MPQASNVFSCHFFDERNDEHDAMRIASG